MSTTQATTYSLAEVFERMGLDISQVKNDAGINLSPDAPECARTMAMRVAEYRWVLTPDHHFSQLHCGGEAIVAIYPEPRGNQYVRTTQPLYIVREDQAERTWHHRRQTECGGDAMATVSKYGPCPRATYRLVQSG